MMLFSTLPVGYLIIISCFLIVFIPVLTVKIFSNYSKRTATKSYLEAEILSLNHRLHWHKVKISTLENGADRNIDHQFPVHVKVFDPIVDLQSETLSHSDTTQIEMDLSGFVDNVTVTDTEHEEYFETANEHPKMIQLKLADQPDVSFLDRLNLKSNVIPFPIELKHDSMDEEDETPMEQMEFTLDVGNMELYRWTKGVHFVHLSIIDHYGEELALCEIQGRTGTTMIQHPKVSSMKDGDSFAASIIVDSKGMKVVDKLWCDLAEEYSWSAEG